ncbi:Recombinational DNA repair ATPase [gamma proteobacterium HdN1]|nr:Recombinational DNA repair ATPase [gamma proteobacterium HdN1]
MAIVKLEISDFRNLKAVEIAPAQGLNWVVGPNGSGKTSLLEALHLLATGKSFRANNLRSCIRGGAKTCRVVCLKNAAAYPDVIQRLGVERDLSGGVRAVLDQLEVTKLSGLANQIAVCTLLPDSINLLIGDPSLRREFLGWSMFHVEHNSDYLQVLRDYRFSLQQRNALLRRLNGSELPLSGNEAIRSKELDGWDRQLGKFALKLDERRSHFMTLFRERYFSLISKEQLNLRSSSYSSNEVHFELLRGWPDGVSLEDALAEARMRDIERGFTGSGPHRADIRISYAGKPVRDYFSRGQLKHLISICVLVQADLIRSSRGKDGLVFIFDDAFAELDENHASSVLAALRSISVQTFVTTSDAAVANRHVDAIQDRMFHVEHGDVQMSVSIPKENY